MSRLLEVCCFSTLCASLAEKAGADRIELCSGYQEGGLTPSYGSLLWIRKEISIPVHPLIRPRGGDFCYDTSEFAVIKKDLSLIRHLNFPGAVVGILDKHNEIDIERMEELKTIAGDLSLTFHRAFDLCPDPFLALKQLNLLGFTRVLTSGKSNYAESGIALLAQLQSVSKKIVVMAGGGIRDSNLSKFKEIGLQEIHTSAGYWKKNYQIDQCGEQFKKQYVVDYTMVQRMKSNWAN